MIFPFILAYAAIGTLIGAKQVSTLPKIVGTWDKHGKSTGSRPLTLTDEVKVITSFTLAWPLLLVAKPN